MTQLDPVLRSLAACADAPEFFAAHHAKRSGETAILVGETAASFIADTMFRCPAFSIAGESIDEWLQRALRRAVIELNRAGVSAVPQE